MAYLSYKTKGMSRPNGEPKVYFCCHPEDFERYFEIISNEILNIYNCIIYYDNSLNRSLDDERKMDLTQMQLFVVPVTMNLLSTENCAIDEEIPYAIEKHIPILPIIQEEGLEEMFNLRVGNLQCLDKNKKDSTTDTYEKKLEKYLSLVLIDDDLAEKVRNAFDAYIFLSYRKKDRKYAQDIMHLIHKNEFCRDIAIWYDEFLTPGEDFNDAILDALKKSELFTLVVTPNLINEPNYVMTTEYPIAQQENKFVIPAEVVITNKKVLKEKYKGIPNCVDAYKKEEFSLALKEKINKIVLKNNDKNPQHNFYIGLAYLNGIDVEVDKKMGVKLITLSAEAGFVDAIEKLINMYHYGDGVNFDIGASAKWSKKLSKIYLNEYKKNHTLENVYKFLEAWSNFGHICELRNEIRLKNEYTFGCKLELQDSIGEYREYFKSNFDIVEKIALDVNNEKSLMELINICYEMIEILNLEQDLDKQDFYLCKILNIYKKLTIKNKKNDNKIKYALKCKDIGLSMFYRGQQEKTKTFFKEFFKVFRKIMKNRKSSGNMFELISSYFSIVTNYYNIRNFKLFEKYSIYGLKSVENIDKKEMDDEILDIYAVICETLGKMYFDNKKFKKANEYYLKGNMAYLKILKNDKELNLWSRYSFNCKKLSEINRLQNMKEKANMYYAEFERVICKFSKNSEFTEIWSKEGSEYYSMAELYRENCDFEQAEEYYNKSLESLFYLFKYTKDLNIKKFFVAIYRSLAEISLSLNKFKEAQKYYNESFKFAREIYEITGEKDDLSEYCFSCYAIAFFSFYYLKELEKAKKYYFKFIEIANPFFEKIEKNILYNDSFLIYVKIVTYCYSCYNDLANIYKEENNINEAKKYYEKSIGVIEFLLKDDEVDKSEYIVSLATIYRNIALLNKEFVDNVLLKKALDILEEYCKLQPNDAMASSFKNQIMGELDACK